MGDVLSQEEIDALLGGAAGISQDVAPGGETEPTAGGRADAPRPLKSDRDRARRLKGKRRGASFKPDDVPVAPAVFQPLTPDEESLDRTNLDLILDTELDLTAELGSAMRTVREILELGPGSVIELNKLSGEPVDLFVNKRNFSRGEVVVIAENFGIRVTDILSVEERIDVLGPS